MAESSDSSYSVDSDSDSILSGSVCYSTDYSDNDDDSINSSVSTEMGVLPYRFEPEASDSESMGGHGGEVDPSRADPSESSLERLGNTDW